MNAINFIKIAFGDYKVGAITVSSKYVVNRVVRAIPLGAKNIIEYGAGNGVITREILKRLPPDGKLIAIESNKKFLPALTKIADKRLFVINKDVAEFLKESKSGMRHNIDAIISGIPFTLFQPAMRNLIVEKTYNILSDEGAFVVYQYSPLMSSTLKKNFKKVKINFEFRNLPPYFIMTAKK